MKCYICHETIADGVDNVLMSVHPGKYFITASAGAHRTCYEEYNYVSGYAFQVEGKWINRKEYLQF